MRLWSWQLLPYLSKNELCSQWRECCCIARNIAVNGTPNHILVNKIMNYPEDEFNTYTDVVIKEMERRGYKVDPWKFYKNRNDINNIPLGGIFRGWHTKVYVKQCMANLMEKHDCGGITDEEWQILLDGYKEITGKEFVL